MKPAETEYGGYIGTYIKLVPENSILDALVNSTKKAVNLFHGISSEKSNFAYAPGKWSIKELIVHITDTERIFSYRALAIARGETQKLPAFDENMYAKNSAAGIRGFENIVEEFEVVRRATQLLFASFSKETLLKMGETPSGLISVNAIGYAICGHTLHHLSVLEAKYLK